MPKLSCALLIAFLAACDGSPEQLRKLVGPDGGIVISTDGKLTLTIPKDALIEDCEITIEVTPTGYTIKPEGKKLQVEAALLLTLNVPQQQSDGGYILQPPRLLLGIDPVTGTIRAEPGATLFEGRITTLDKIHIEDSYLDMCVLVKSDLPGTATASVEVTNRAAAGGTAPALKDHQVQIEIDPQLWESAKSDLEDPPGSNISTGTTFTGLPGGRHTVTVETKAEYFAPNHSGYTFVTNWKQPVDVEADTETKVVPFEQGTAPEGLSCLDNLDGYAWTVPGDDPVMAAFSDGAGIFNYKTGAVLGNAPNKRFYGHFSTVIGYFGACAGRSTLSVQFLRDSSLQQTTPPVDVMLSFGAGGALIRYWDDTLMDFQTPVVLETVTTTDGAPYEGDPTSGGFTYVSDAGNFVKFLEFDQTSRIYEVDDTKTITAANLPNASGAIVSAFWPDRSGDVLIATDGDPGQLWVKTPGQAGAATLIGTVGTRVRRVRTLGEVGVVSAYGSDFGFGSLTFLTRSSGTWSFAPFGILGQRSIGVDLRQLTNGEVAVASCGFLNDTYRITVLSPNGEIVSDVTHDLPAGAEGPGHVIWLPDGGLLISCNTTNNMVIVPPVSFS